MPRLLQPRSCCCSSCRRLFGNEQVELPPALDLADDAVTGLAVDWSKGYDRVLLATVEALDRTARVHLAVWRSAAPPAGCGSTAWPARPTPPLMLCWRAPVARLAPCVVARGYMGDQRSPAQARGPRRAHAYKRRPLFAHPAPPSCGLRRVAMTTTWSDFEHMWCGLGTTRPAFRELAWPSFSGTMTDKRHSRPQIPGRGRCLRCGRLVKPSEEHVQSDGEHGIGEHERAQHVALPLNRRAQSKTGMRNATHAHADGNARYPCASTKASICVRCAKRPVRPLNTPAVC